jgi:antitoxin component of MazEF toxin-antitoxin module
MPIVRKITGHGGSRGVTLPASWIKLIEKETGKKLKEVMMDVDGAITIKPLIEKKDSVNVACTTVREAEVS